MNFQTVDDDIFWTVQRSISHLQRLYDVKRTFAAKKWLFCLDLCKKKITWNFKTPKKTLWAQFSLISALPQKRSRAS